MRRTAVEPLRLNQRCRLAGARSPGGVRDPASAGGDLAQTSTHRVDGVVSLFAEFGAAEVKVAPVTADHGATVRAAARGTRSDQTTT
jgi:hypothetical protein